MTYKTGRDWWMHQSAPIKKLLTGAIVYDAYYDAILGVAILPKGPVLVYSTRMSIDELAKDMKTSDPNEDNPYTMALEYWDFNVAGGWIGDRTPLLLDDLSDTEVESNALIREHNPGFMGFATRCSDRTYAVMEDIGRPNDAELTLPIYTNNGPQDIIIPFLDMISMRRIPDATVVSSMRKKTHRNRHSANG